MDGTIDTTTGGSVAERLARLKLSRLQQGTDSDPLVSSKPPIPALPARPPSTPAAKKPPPPPLPTRAHTTANAAAEVKLPVKLPARTTKPGKDTPVEPERPRILAPLYNDAVASLIQKPVEKVPSPSIATAELKLPKTRTLPPPVPPVPPRRVSSSSFKSNEWVPPDVKAQPIPPRRKLPPPASEAPPRRPSPAPRQVDSPKPQPPVPPPINLASRPVAPTAAAPRKDASEASCLICRDFSGPDLHSARPQFSRENVTSIHVLARDLCSPFDEDIDKARAIFTWMHHNIAYDVHGFFNNCIRFGGPMDTLRKGVGVCQGYAELYREIAQAVGLKCEVVSGFGKGYGYVGSSVVRPFDTNHAWNAVYFGQPWGWWLIDSCWGAGVSSNPPPTYKKQFNPKQFISSPREFGKRHFPKDSKWQCTTPRQTWEDFIVEKEEDLGPKIWSACEDDGWDKNTVTPWSPTLSAGRHFISIKKMCPHWKSKHPGHKEYLLIIWTGSQRIPLEPVDDMGTVGAEVYVTEGADVKIAAVKTMGDSDGRDISAQEFRSNVNRVGSSYAFLCGWNLKD